MGRLNLNYFTCTLDQAALLRERRVGSAKSFETVLKLIDEQGEHLPNTPAFGFANFKPTNNNDRRTLPDLVTYSELRDLSISAATALSDVLGLYLEDKPATVGLLCSSSLNFVLAWLGLMRLGFTALILAPELDARAIQHLCANSNTTTILVDSVQEKTIRSLKSLNVIRIPTFSAVRTRDGGVDVKNVFAAGESDIAFLRHTSGTSSGIPKLVAQSQWGTVGCFVPLSRIRQPATFTTTPLYHGGLADCFRAWTSGAMIWFFPEGLMPITGANITQSIIHARKISPVPVGYFSSVPYVLQLLVDEPNGVYMLQSMELVGVGGAALAPSIGDKLVKLGVNLVSRMGSTECGFLMSSHRDYAYDKEWQYFRLAGDSTFLSLEPRENCLSELVVKPRWPLREKTNRDDGSYATADLFEPHPSISNAWRYHSRADALITLANGKKFDPSPLEDNIKASSPLVRDVFIFGANKEYAGALLFKAPSGNSDSDVINAVWPHIHNLNKETQSHCRLSRSMLIPIESKGAEEPLPKSSKGTTQRRIAEHRYSNIIGDAYSHNGATSTKIGRISNEDILSVLLDLFIQVSGRDVHPRQDIFQQGVDSIMCIQVRKLIESTILSDVPVKVPESFIYDCGNIYNLADELIRVRSGGKFHNSRKDVDEWKFMEDLADEYSQFETHHVDLIYGSEEVVVLTGATGMLGSHVLSELRRDSRISKIYCLLRGQSESACQKNLSKALEKRKVLGLDSQEASPCKIVCVPCQLSEPRLGLSTSDWIHLVAESTIYVHTAWSVNFTLPLDSEEFRNHVKGVHNLINAALSSRARFFFISSTAAVSSSPSANITEEVSSDPSHASPLGYSRSKWVAERVCSNAYEQLYNSVKSEATRHAEVSVIRVGQLCGDEAGVWNMTEAYPLLLSTAGLVGCLPDLPNEILNWLPVDQAARVISDIMLPDRTPNVSKCSKMLVYHVLNFHKSPSWSQMVRWISEAPGYSALEVVRPEEWLERLELGFKNADTDHPAQALFDLWKRRYSSAKDIPKTPKCPSFDATLSIRSSRTMRDTKPLGHDEVISMWHWIGSNMGSYSEGSST
ncbi:acetyl-CoA synthetase-like protein [Daldinia sp. FL1419]|nr:acetyl-CoA synthetase-like protein [Daldinia sp. FL1419]